MMFDVTAKVRIRVHARDVNHAENRVLNLLTGLLDDAGQVKFVAETGVELSPSSPASVEVKGEDNAKDVS